MKKSLILLVGSLTVAASAQLGLPGSGTQTVFRVTSPVSTQTVLSVEQPPFPTGRTTVPSPTTPQPMLTLAQAFSNLTQTVSPAVAQPTVPAAPSVVPPKRPMSQVAPAIPQRTLSLSEAVSNLVPAGAVQPSIPVASSIVVPESPSAPATVPVVQPALGLSQNVSNLAQNALSSVAQPVVPSATSPTIPSGWAAAPVTQAVSVLNQAVSVLTQRVSAVNQTALSLTQQALPTTQTDVSIPQPTLPAVPEIPIIQQPDRSAAQNAGTPSFQIANAGIRPPSPQFRQIEKPYYGVEESNIAELPVGMRFDERISADGAGLESTWTNGAFAYEATGRYTLRTTTMRGGGGIFTNMIAEQIRMPIVSTNVSQVGGTTVVSEKTSLCSEGIWVGDVLKYPMTSVLTNTQVVISSVNGRTVKLARKEDIILELAQPSRILRPDRIAIGSANPGSALDSLPRPTISIPEANVPGMALPAVPSAPSVPSAAEGKTLSLLEAQTRGIDIRLREVTVIKWVWTTNNYNNLPRRTPVPHKMWVLGSEPVAEGSQLF